MDYESVGTNKTIPFLTFRPHPTQIRSYLEERGCFSKANKAIYRELLDLTDLNETECIHDDLNLYSGITLYVSRQKLAGESGYSLRQVSYALKALRDCKVIKQLDKHPETGCYRYKLQIYDDAIEYLKANPDHPRCQVETLAVSPEQIQAYAESAMAMFDRLESLESLKNAENEGRQSMQGGSADIAHKKDYKEGKKQGPHPLLLISLLLGGMERIGKTFKNIPKGKKTRSMRRSPMRVLNSLNSFTVPLGMGFPLNGR